MNQYVRCGDGTEFEIAMGYAYSDPEHSHPQRYINKSVPWIRGGGMKWARSNYRDLLSTAIAIRESETSRVVIDKIMEWTECDFE